MTKAIVLVLLLNAVACNVACAEDQCPLRNWAAVKQNLEYTANTPGPDNRGCAEVRVHSGENAYDAFKHCNSALRSPLLGAFGVSSSMYIDCAPHVCDWFKAQRPPWKPAC
jgi:hypothetical protein